MSIFRIVKENAQLAKLSREKERLVLQRRKREHLAVRLVLQSELFLLQIDRLVLQMLRLVLQTIELESKLPQSMLFPPN